MIQSVPTVARNRLRVENEGKHGRFAVEGESSLMLTQANELVPIAVARFDLGAATLTREGVFPAFLDADRLVEKVAASRGLVLADPVEVNADGLGLARLLDATGQTVIEFHFVAHDFKRYRSSEGVALFSVSMTEGGRLVGVAACGVYGSHAEVMEAEEFGWSVVKGSAGRRGIGITIPFAGCGEVTPSLIEETG